MQSCNLVLAISAIACEIAKNKTAEEISLLGSIFTQLGDTLNTIVVQEASCSSKTTGSNLRNNQV